MRPFVFFILSTLVSVASIYNKVNAQDCNAYFPYKSGITIGMSHFDKKDKLTGSTLQTVKEIREIAGGMEFIISQVHKDEKGKEILSGDFVISCQDGLIKMDMRRLLGADMMEAYKDMEIQIEGDELEFPAKLNVGQKLKGGVMNVAIINQGLKMLGMQVTISDRTVEAKEEITTPAGTYNCFKISYDTETKMLLKVKSKSEEWIAEGIGVVKTASYNSNGKLESYTLVTSFNQ